MSHYFSCDKDTAVVSTKQGKVRGYVYDDMTIFKGIPYAKARRFHRPEAVEPWEGVFDATNYGYVCPLLEEDQPLGEIKVPHRFWAMNENCQNLNIWTPACDDGKRPVMVWLHGGGFRAGSSIEQVAYEGENMCHFGQVVVVSINHRLNVLGYCDLSEFGAEYENSANAGTDDMVAALRWIHENIEAFGGDPENVTLFGQSGGGAKVTALLQSPEADGFYARGIVMSGVMDDMQEEHTGSGRALVEAMMTYLHLTDVRDLETVPYALLADAYKYVVPMLEKEGVYVGGLPKKNAFYAGVPCKYGFRKETSQRPLLVGTVFGEFSSFAAPKYRKHEMTRAAQMAAIIGEVGEESAKLLVPMFEKAYPERQIIDILNMDFIFRRPGQTYIWQRSGLNANTYSYIFNLDLPIDGGTTPWHCADIPYVFHNTALVPVTQEPGVTDAIEKQIFDTVMAFARTGNPNNESIPNWPASTEDKEYIMLFDKNTRLVCNHDRELVPLLEKCMAEVFAAQMASAEIQH